MSLPFLGRFFSVVIKASFALFLCILLIFTILQKSHAWILDQDPPFITVTLDCAEPGQTIRYQMLGNSSVNLNPTAQLCSPDPTTGIMPITISCADISECYVLYAEINTTTNISGAGATRVQSTDAVYNTSGVPTLTGNGVVSGKNIIFNFNQGLHNSPFYNIYVRANDYAGNITNSPVPQVPWEGRFTIEGRAIEDPNGNCTGTVPHTGAGATYSTNFGTINQPGTGGQPSSYDILSIPYGTTVVVNMTSAPTGFKRPPCDQSAFAFSSITSGPNVKNFFITQTSNFEGFVYIDYDHNAAKDSYDTNRVGATVTLTGCSENRTTTTDSSGKYIFTQLPACTYTVSVADSGTGYTATYPANSAYPNPRSVTVTSGANTIGVNFLVTPLYTISGNIFVDNNVSRIKEASESNYAGSSTLRVSPNANPGGTAAADIPTGNGSYTATVISGQYIVEYLPPLPAGYYRTYPQNNPASFPVTVGYPGAGIPASFRCNVGSHNSARCSSGSVLAVAVGPPSGYINATVGETYYNEPTQEANIFYVSPSGSNSNDGQTPQTPWASFRKAAATLTAGQMALFENGTYIENGPIPNSAFINSGSGTPGNSDFKPIVVKARNKHQAVIRFENTTNETGFWIMGKDNIVIRDFVMEKPSLSGSTYGDGIMRTVNNPPTYPPSGTYDPAENVYLLGNWFRNSFELIKSTGAPNNTLDSNILSNTATAFGAVLGDTVIFRNNEVRDFTETALQMKGGSINGQVYNNYVHTNRDNGQAGIGMYIGGNGWESFNNVYYNNLIVGEIPGALDKGVVFQGCHNCGFSNNIIVGAKVGIGTFDGDMGSFGKPSSPGNTDYLYTKNAVIRNNIIQNCTFGYGASSTMINATIDHNLFNCTNGNVPPGSLTGDPLITSDGHLQAGSKAIGAGIPVSFTTYNGTGFIDYGSGLKQFNGTTLDVSKDKNGTSRTDPWDLGIYAYGASAATPPPVPTATPPPVEPGTTLTGSIIDLNFGISNSLPWTQCIGGDCRNDSGYKSPVPADANSCVGAGNDYASIPSSSSTPGVIFSGNNDFSFCIGGVGSCQNKASSTQWVVKGDATYPAEYSSPYSRTKSSFQEIYDRDITKGGNTPTPLGNVCSLSNCSIANLPNGIYTTTSNVTITASTLQSNRDIIILVGNINDLAATRTVTIQGNILVPTTSTFTLSVRGDIAIAATVGELEGFYSADKNFTVQTASTTTCDAANPDKRLNIAGSIVANAGYMNGTFNNLRNLCGNNKCPAVTFRERPDFFLNAPQALQYKSLLWKEVAP